MGYQIEALYVKNLATRYILGFLLFIKNSTFPTHNFRLFSLISDQF